MKEEAEILSSDNQESSPTRTTANNELPCLADARDHNHSDETRILDESGKEEEEDSAGVDDESQAILTEWREIAIDRHGYQEWYTDNLFRTVIGFQKRLPSPTQAAPNRVADVRLQLHLESNVVSVVIDHRQCLRHRNQTLTDVIFASDDGEDEVEAEYMSTKLFLYQVQNVTTPSLLDPILSDPIQFGKAQGGYTCLRDTKTPTLSMMMMAPFEWSGNSLEQQQEEESCANCGMLQSELPPNQSSLKKCPGCNLVKCCGRESQEQHRKKETRLDCDSARRWHSIVTTSGLLSSQQQLKALREVSNALDSLLFEPGMPPYILECSRYACGAPCCISNLLLDIGRDHYNAIGFCRISDAMDRFYGRTESIENHWGHMPPCANADDFMEDFGPQIQAVRDQLDALEPCKLRKEVLLWHFERIHCDSGMCMIDEDEMPLCSVDTSFRLHSCHLDYSRLVYDDDTEAEKYHHGGMCFMHGTFHPQQCQHEHQHDEVDQDEVSEVGEAPQSPRAQDAENDNDSDMASDDGTEATAPVSVNDDDDVDDFKNDDMIDQDKDEQEWQEATN